MNSINDFFIITTTAFLSVFITLYFCCKYIAHIEHKKDFDLDKIIREYNFYKFKSERRINYINIMNDKNK